MAGIIVGVAEVDPDQLAALRRLRAAFGAIWIVKVIDHDAGEDQDEAPAQGELFEDRPPRS